MWISFWFRISLLFFIRSSLPVCSRCLKNQESLLLAFEKDHSIAAGWNQSVDRCDWGGITCDTEGHVTGLDLNNQNLYGAINDSSSLFRLQSLQSLNLAYNYFDPGLLPSGFGALPPTLFASFRGISVKFNDTLSYLYFKHPANSAIYYQDSASVVIKGADRKLEKILNIFASIDFSNNSFQGSIPVTVGDLKLIKLVNLSYNALTGLIPVSVGKLTNLESLDLSANKLSGSIPRQLASLSFLSSLNLSYNELSGRIPHGSQFQTFTELSFIGNQGLCGMPLNKSCNVNVTSTETNEDVYHATDLYVSIGLGFVVGLVMIVGPLVLSRRWRRWCSEHVDGLVSRVVKTKDKRTK